MLTYEQAVKNQAKAAAAYSKASDKLQEANKSLEEAKRELTCQCPICHHETKVKDIELIDKMYGGYRSFDTYDTKWIYEHNIFWVCSTCNSLINPPENEGPWIQGFEKYVKKIHKWESDQEQCHGRVLELIGPYLKFEASRKEKEERERKIKEAKKLLADEGLL